MNSRFFQSALLVGMAGLTPAVAQVEPVKLTVSRITVGDASGPPGTSVIVPITFEHAENVRARRIELTLTYRSAHLHFTRLDRGGATSDTRQVDWFVQDHAIAGDGRQQTSKLTLIASLLQSGDDVSQPALEGGILGELTFRIDEDADATVLLDASAKMTEAGSYTVVSSPKLQTRDGTVYVLAPGNMPGIGCFFFTH